MGKNKKQYLNKSESKEFIENLAEIMTKANESVLKLADQMNIDRDSAMNYYSMTLTNMVMVSTWQNYKFKGE